MGGFWPHSILQERKDLGASSHLLLFHPTTPPGRQPLARYRAPSVAGFRRIAYYKRGWICELAPISILSFRLLPGLNVRACFQ